MALLSLGLRSVSGTSLKRILLLEWNDRSTLNFRDYRYCSTTRLVSLVFLSRTSAAMFLCETTSFLVLMTLVTSFSFKTFTTTAGYCGSSGGLTTDARWEEVCG